MGDWFLEVREYNQEVENAFNEINRAIQKLILLKEKKKYLFRINPMISYAKLIGFLIDETKEELEDFVKKELGK